MIGTFRVNEPMPPEGSEVWWRAEDRVYANFDPWNDGDYCGSYSVVELTPYKVTKATPKGVWVRAWLGHEQFVLGTAGKQLAVPTQELALADLVRRKEVHASFARARADRAQKHLEMAQKCLARLQSTNEK